MWRRGTETFPLAKTCSICGGEPNHHGGCSKVPSSIEELCDRNQYNCDWFGPMGSISMSGGERNDAVKTEERDRVYQDQLGRKMSNPPILQRPRTTRENIELMNLAKRRHQERPPMRHPIALSAGPDAEVSGTWRTGFNRQPDRQQDRYQDRQRDRVPPPGLRSQDQEKTI